MMPPKMPAKMKRPRKAVTPKTPDVELKGVVKQPKVKEPGRVKLTGNVRIK